MRKFLLIIFTSVCLCWVHATTLTDDSGVEDVKKAVRALQAKAGKPLDDTTIGNTAKQFVDYKQTLKDVHVIWRLLASMMAVGNEQATRLHDAIVLSGYNQDNNIY